ncbi:rhodanese-like domain-containing protein [Porticoccus sp. W117]|uniref:rhodanese-like domain-containing protein n=1 Tax=Porticoccus sp. W117 TaxID=3054777 RepID=UPI0025958EB0|nr:rhodanese-like domain-containing protein [Porticoccus sp. W117]MDM3870719.1 rhodanese-like domain-containing protein [Porticoccus sp. W117]
MNKRRLPQIAIIAVVFAGLIVAVLLANKPRLEDIHQTILADYRNVEHISAEQLKALEPGELVIFDVREDSEFLVSHMDGALQVEPGLSADEFMDQYGNQLVGKTAIFYCSVGRRSSALISDLAPRLSVTTKAYNLSGGLFQWHNQGRELVNDEGEMIQAIHPYNRYWGQLIVDKSAIRFDVDD